MVYSEDRSTQKDTSSSAVTSSLSDLIARLEKATAGSRELDAEIGAALGLCDHSGPAHHRPFKDWAKPYTSSIDAAMTLVPEGHLWKCGYSRYVPHIAEIVDYDSHRGSFVGECDSNRAIALCIASLKARASHQESGAETDGGVG